MGSNSRFEQAVPPSAAVLCCTLPSVVTCLTKTGFGAEEVGTEKRSLKNDHSDGCVYQVIPAEDLGMTGWGLSIEG